MIVTEQTKALGQRVYDFLTFNPERHNQMYFVADSDGNDSFSSASDITEENICDTTLCAAGAAVLLAEGEEGIKYHIENAGWSEKAGALLGLDHNEQYDLFLCMDNEKALNLVSAIANGDADKFAKIAEDEE